MGPDAVLAEVVAGLRRALDADPPRSRWSQLATADASGVARVRTVVLHEVTDDGRFAIATDAASEKVAHVRARPRGELCVVSREHLEQWRLLATLAEGGLEERRRLWRSLPPRERGYYISPPPGLERARFPESAFKGEAHGDEPAERFVALLGVIERIDRLDVSTTPHRRFLYSRDERWRKVELSP